MAIKWDSSTKFVVSGVPFHSTLAPAAKPLPITEIFSAGTPAPMTGGSTEAIDGPSHTIRLAGSEVSPLDVTVIEAVPGFATSVAAERAVRREELTKDVG